MDVNYLRARLSSIAVIGLCLLVTACAGPSKTATEAAAVVSKPITTGETLQIIKTLNDGEIRQAELALERSPTNAVREVAQLILDNHKASNDKVAKLAEERGVELDKSPLSRGLEGQADRMYDKLKSQSGPEFDCHYLQGQQKLHAVALETLTRHVAPQAELADTRQLLSETAPTLEKHREAARQGIASLPACDTVDAG